MGHWREIGYVGKLEDEEWYSSHMLVGYVGKLEDDVCRQPMYL